MTSLAGKNVRRRCRHCAIVVRARCVLVQRLQDDCTWQEKTFLLFFNMNIYDVYSYTHVGHSHGRLNCILKKIPHTAGVLAPPFTVLVGAEYYEPQCLRGHGYYWAPSLLVPSQFVLKHPGYISNLSNNILLYSPLCAFANFKVQFSFCRNQRVTTIWIGYQPLNTPVVCGVGLHYHWALQRASSYRFGLSHLTPSPFVGGCDITEPLFPATDLL